MSWCWGPWLVFCDLHVTNEWTSLVTSPSVMFNLFWISELLEPSAELNGSNPAACKIMLENLNFIAMENGLGSSNGQITWYEVTISSIVLLQCSYFQWRNPFEFTMFHLGLIEFLKCLHAFNMETRLTVSRQIIAPSLCTTFMLNHQINICKWSQI